eukprot:scaffold93491_cov66-Phaeocystis_antarctica.AAC.4
MHPSPSSPHPGSSDVTASSVHSVHSVHSVRQRPHASSVFSEVKFRGSTTNTAKKTVSGLETPNACAWSQPTRLSRSALNLLQQSVELLGLATEPAREGRAHVRQEVVDADRGSVGQRLAGRPHAARRRAATRAATNHGCVAAHRGRLPGWRHPCAVAAWYGTAATGLAVRATEA